MFLEAYHCLIGRYSNMNQSSRAATENFVFLKVANNGSLKTNCCFESIPRWNVLAKNWPASRQENGFFFSFSLMGVALVFTKKKQKLSHARNASQSQDGGFLEDLFAVCRETWVALDTSNLVTFFSEVWQNAPIFS